MAETTPRSRRTPASMGYAMPAEWEPHEATWLVWPQNASDWPDKLEVIRWVYVEIIRKILPGEKVRLLVGSRHAEAEAKSCLMRSGIPMERVEFIRTPTDRGWTRDAGPLFVRRTTAKGWETAIVQFHFNAWARYRNWKKDRRIPEVAASLLGKRIFHATHRGRPFVLEGGGVEVNGCGVVLSTEECYLNPEVQVRNPGCSRQDYEKVFASYLGAKHPFWLLRGPEGDDTHGHVDDICRFVNRNTLVLVREDNPADANYRPLAENWERIGDLRLEDGSRPDVVALPMPGPLYFDGDRLPASYANFYIANAAVLVPTFNDPNDRVALGILSELFSGRPVVGIHAVDLILGFGALHCLTQQQPAEGRPCG